ncbi:MAG: hypothetical protein GC201_15360 [Alphaproteobacteria bacterium]|nr:hypothetical protein [Alphaproteobacteria bacterium]
MDLTNEALARWLGRVGEWLNLPEDARRIRRSDRRSALAEDPGADRAVAAMLDWLDEAQQEGGGIAEHFSLLSGWSGVCPASTGATLRVLVPLPDREAQSRRALHAVLALQRPDGGFPDSPEWNRPSRPFASGQALLGLVAAERRFGGLKEAVAMAAGWLAETQEAKGYWTHAASGLQQPGGRSYDAQAAWALLEADSLLPGHGWRDAALSALAWTQAQQRGNGWFDHCTAGDRGRPLTLTLGLAVRGFLESYRLARVLRHLDAAVMAGWALVAVQRKDGALPGALDDKWEADAAWSCLPGNAAVASCWMLLYRETRDEAFLRAARAANGFNRRTLSLEGRAATKGGVRGSYPVDGGYARFRYPSIGAVLAVESNRLEDAVTGDLADSGSVASS